MWTNFFFFQAEDGIRDVAVTGVQTCALPICDREHLLLAAGERARELAPPLAQHGEELKRVLESRDRKSTRLNSSHGYISYAVFCFKKKIELRITRLFDGKREQDSPQPPSRAG